MLRKPFYIDYFKKTNSKINSILIKANLQLNFIFRLISRDVYSIINKKKQQLNTKNIIQNINQYLFNTLKFNLQIT